MNELTIFPDGVRQVTCQDCLQAASEKLGFQFSMAFQPIVDVVDKSIFAYEALVRGPKNEPAGSILSQINDDNRYYFDQAARVTAIRLAADLGMPKPTRLSINFMPNAVYKLRACIRATIEAARHYHFDSNRIMFEVTEGEQVIDRNKLCSIFDEYREQGLIRAIDDYGEGFAGLNHLIELEPDVVKMDMNLIRDLNHRPAKRAAVRSTVMLCNEMNIDLIAEGVETIEESRCLTYLGVRLQQGYLFAKPGFETLPEPNFVVHD